MQQKMDWSTTCNISWTPAGYRASKKHTAIPLWLLLVQISLLIVCVLFCSPAAYSQSLPSTSTVHSYAFAVRKAAPSVVNIYTLRKTLYPTRQDQYRKTQQQNRRNLQRQQGRRRTTLGSGVIMDEQGYILTNYHVVRNARTILVAVPDGRRTTAKVIGSDPDSDLAVLRVYLKNLKPIVIGNSNDVNVGDVVLAIGNPYGLGQTVTQGIVSALGRSRIGINPLETYIQTDAAINPGNSGGALVNTHGRLVGINTGLYSRSGGFQGIGFAIPVNVALNIMGQIIKYGYVKRGWLGTLVTTLTYGQAKKMGLQQSVGVIITRVVLNSPAAKAGLRVHDVVTHIDQHRVRNARGYSSYIAQHQPGSIVVLTLLRKHVKKIVSIKLGIRPAPSPDTTRGRLVPQTQLHRGVPREERFHAP